MNKYLKIIAIIFLSLLLATTALARSRWWNCTSLTGGAEGALDAINGQNLFDGYRAIVITESYTYFYYLDADSGASESTPDVISPDTNAGDKRWLIVPVYTP